MTVLLSGVAVSFLLLALLIAVFIAGVVLLRRAKWKRKALKKRSPSVESMECIEKVEEPQGKVEEPTTGNECERCIDDARVQQYVDTPDAVYAVVDKSKKKKKGTAEGDQNTTATQDPYTDEQHYKSSTVIGKDWVGNVEGEASGDEMQNPSNDGNITGPHSEPCDPSAVYAVVDKSKKKKKEN